VRDLREHDDGPPEDRRAVAVLLIRRGQSVSELGMFAPGTWEGAKTVVSPG
jgi:hypothetical protein